MKDIQGQLGRPVDIVGYDACMMAMAEVAAEFSDSVDYLVASEKSSNRQTAGPTINF